MVPPDDSPLLTERCGNALFVTLNRPKARNALSGAMLDALDRLIAELQDERAIGVVVLRGAGGYFCSGGDLKERALLPLGSDGEGSLQARNLREGALLRAIDSLPQIVVGAVEGGAVGGGLGIVCVSDVVIATASSTFSAPEVRSAAVPAQIMPFIMRRLGWSHGRKMLITGEKCDAAEACRIGIVHEIAPVETPFDEAVDRLVASLASCDPVAVGGAKQLMAKLRIEPDGYSEMAAQLYVTLLKPRG
jgi:isohexenylglutaconyl-CoA hydratase